MCGLVGVAGDVFVKERDVFNELLLADVVRGAHSTGAAAVKRHESEILMEKMPGPSQYLVGSPQYKKMVETLGLKCLIGHNRFATVGEKTVNNAHPFQFDGLVGAHNGTLDHWALKRLDDWNTFGTDSEAVYNSIAKHGVKATIEQLTGAWALTWFDGANNTLNFLRNSKRTLFYTYSQDRQSIFWASEKLMLEWILTRNNVKFFQDEIYTIDPDMHHRWVLPEFSGQKFDKPTITEIKESAFKHNARTFSEDWSNSDYWYSENGVTRYDPTGTKGRKQAGPPWYVKKAEKAVPPPAEKIDTAGWRPPYKDTSGRVLKKPEVEALMANGCLYCDKDHSEWLDFIHLLPLDLDNRQNYLCEECYNDDDVRELISNVLV
jgi:predicted glutamine amidotransferase